MVKTAIKHYIFEACINILFKNIQQNFNAFEKKTMHNIKRGEKFEEITAWVKQYEETPYCHIHIIGGSVSSFITNANNNCIGIRVRVLGDMYVDGSLAIFGYCNIMFDNITNYIK